MLGWGGQAHPPEGLFSLPDPEQGSFLEAGQRGLVLSGLCPLRNLRKGFLLFSTHAMYFLIRATSLQPAPKGRGLTQTSCVSLTRNGTVWA